jgi:hypothetical protein
MDAHQYVRGDVTSGHICNSKFYYTHQSFMDADNYVQVYVASVYIFY